MPDNFMISSLETDQQNDIVTDIAFAESTYVTSDEPGLTVLLLEAALGADNPPPAVKKPAVTPARVKVATSALRRPPSDLRRLDKRFRRICVQLRREYKIRTPSELDALENLASDLMWRGELQAAVRCLGRSIPALHDVTPEGLAQLQKDYDNAPRIRRALTVLEGSSDKPLSKTCSSHVAGLVQESMQALADRGTWAKRDWLKRLRYAQDDGLWNQLEPYRKELGSRAWVSGVLSGALQPVDGQKRALITVLQQRGELHYNWQTLKASEQRIMEHSQQSLAELMQNGALSKHDRALSAVNERIAKQKKELEPCRRAVPGRGDRRR